MAVSKIAVMALVGILAIPILLGYGLNLSETTETAYSENKDNVNVTQLLQTGTSYNYSHADASKLNTKFELHQPFSSQYSASNPTVPIYDRITLTKSSLFMNQYTHTGQPVIAGDLSNYHYVYLVVSGFTQDNYVWVTITTPGGNDNITRLMALSYNYETHTLDYMYQNEFNGRSVHESVTANSISLTYHIEGNFTGSCQEHWYYKPTDTTTSYGWVDFSSGFHFEGSTNNFWVGLPDYTKSLLMTINLDSITDSNYTIPMSIAGNSFRLQKTTTDGTINWEFIQDYPSNRFTLYYEQNRNDNTYQIFFDINTKNPDTGGESMKIEFRYVGSWPKLIGESNTYWTKSIIYPYPSPTTYNFNNVTFGDSGYQYTILRTPTIRIDDAYFRAFEYPIINDSTYAPADFRDNPSTTIKDIRLYGQSITFGGNTYPVDIDGNITLGIHKIPVNKLVLNSVPVAVGYENRISDTVISVTAEPSTITFNGKWSASINTVSQTATTYTKTEWVAGEFAWDGMDTNFLIVGLITCLGVFVALGIYVRKSGKGMIPLLIVCGCCAGLFFCMI